MGISPTGQSDGFLLGPADGLKDKVESFGTFIAMEDPYAQFHPIGTCLNIHSDLFSPHREIQ